MKLGLTYSDVQIVPSYSDIDSRSECNTTTTFCGKQYKIPLVPANMQTIVGAEMLKTMHNMGGIGIMHRFNGWQKELSYLEDGIQYAASIGVDDIEAQLTWFWGLTLLHDICMPDFLVIDVAHGHHNKVKTTIKRIKDLFPSMPVVAGNVATGEGALFLAQRGADAVKVGVGNGSLCETRIRTGIGMPQFTALQNVSDCLERNDFGHIGIMADGGVETPGDVAKALAAGADMVMSGNFFSGTEETPNAVLKGGDWMCPTLYKQYAGSASYLAKHQNGQTLSNIEGNSKLIPYKGSCIRIVEEVMNGLKSSMSYVGARNLKEFRSNSEFVQVTPNGTREARPYLLG